MTSQISFSFRKFLEASKQDDEKHLNKMMDKHTAQSAEEEDEEHTDEVADHVMNVLHMNMPRGLEVGDVEIENGRMVVTVYLPNGQTSFSTPYSYSKRETNIGDILRQIQDFAGDDYDDDPDDDDDDDRYSEWEHAAKRYAVALDHKLGDSDHIYIDNIKNGKIKIEANHPEDEKDEEEFVFTYESPHRDVDADAAAILKKIADHFKDKK